MALLPTSSFPLSSSLVLIFAPMLFALQFLFFCCGFKKKPKLRVDHTLDQDYNMYRPEYEQHARREERERPQQSLGAEYIPEPHPKYAGPEPTDPTIPEDTDPLSKDLIGPVWTWKYRRVKSPDHGKAKIYVPSAHPEPIYLPPADPEHRSKPPYTIVSLGRIQQMGGVGSAKEKKMKEMEERKGERKPEERRGGRTEERRRRGKMEERRGGGKAEEKRPDDKKEARMKEERRHDGRGKKPEPEAKSIMYPVMEADVNSETIRNADMERDYGLKLSPKRLVFDSSVPKEPVKLELWNTTENARAVKFKCQDAGIFRVKPPYLLIKPGERRSVVINRLQAPPKADVIEIVTVEVHPNAKLDKKDLAHLIKHTTSKQLLLQRIDIHVK